MYLNLHIVAWMDEATLGFVNYFTWQQILWLQTAWFEPDDEPPDGGTPIYDWLAALFARPFAFQTKIT